jgi:hypothetical protein
MIAALGDFGDQFGVEKMITYLGPLKGIPICTLKKM